MQDMKTPLDATVASIAVSSPIWYQYIETALGIFMLIGGAADFDLGNVNVRYR